MKSMGKTVSVRGDTWKVWAWNYDRRKTGEGNALFRPHRVIACLPGQFLALRNASRP
ncbi:MAG: hypothetical protein WBV82_18875 [Myxococcaceae bacterium]